MSELLGIARLKIHSGKLQEFKNLAAECMESVRTRDSGTLLPKTGGGAPTPSHGASNSASPPSEIAEAPPLLELPTDVRSRPTRREAAARATAPRFARQAA